MLCRPSAPTLDGGRATQWPESVPLGVIPMENAVFLSCPSSSNRQESQNKQEMLSCAWFDNHLKRGLPENHLLNHQWELPGDY